MPSVTAWYCDRVHKRQVQFRLTDIWFKQHLRKDYQLKIYLITARSGHIYFLEFSFKIFHSLYWFYLPLILDIEVSSPSSVSLYQFNSVDEIQVIHTPSTDREFRSVCLRSLFWVSFKIDHYKNMGNLRLTTINRWIMCDIVLTIKPTQSLFQGNSSV